MKAKAAMIVTASILLISALFSFLFYFDNKYHMGPPYGNTGEIYIQENVLDDNQLVFLIDDWEFYNNQLYTSEDFKKGDIISPHHIFIGQYPNFTLMKETVFTKATYRLTVHREHSKQELFMKIPEIFTSYSLYIDGNEIPVKTGDIVSLGKEEQTEIIIQIKESTHYYDGLYYPPAIGSSQAIHRLSTVNNLIYAVMAIFSFTLVSIAYTLRKYDKEKIFVNFSFLCLCFALYCLYPFLHITTTFSEILYRYEDFMNYLMIVVLLKLCASLAQINTGTLYRKFILPLSLFVLILSVVIPTFILPQHKTFINTYGALIDIYKWISSLYLLYCSYYAFKKHNLYAIFILAGGTIFALSQLFNFFFNNLFEPIYGCWQSEYGSFIIIIIFFTLILKRNRLILKENIELNAHLEVAIEERTKEVTHLLEERKAFFSDIAHDLKAPLGAIHNYTKLIEQNNIAIDNETRSYLQSIERKNQLMAQRIISLNKLTEFDKIKGEYKELSINKLLRIFYEENTPEANALGIHFSITYLKEDAYIYGQEEKIETIFENLFYNALSFTPMNGYIRLDAICEDPVVHLTFSDTGKGIDQKDLPYIFERFFSKRESEEEKSGLGLYIVQMIVNELHGTINVTSALHQGTTFHIRIPLLFSTISKEENDAFTL